MADYKNIIPFIRAAEGGYVNNPADLGGETNKGITYATWKQFFGDDHARFVAMSDADWGYIFKHGFWDAINGDAIQSQAVADFLADWNWGSGVYARGYDLHINNVDYGQYGVQKVLNDMGANLAVDGKIGPMSVAAINSADTATLLSGLQQNRSDYYNALVQAMPSQQQFYTGWMNRLNNLYAQVSTYINDITTAVADNPGTSGVTALFFCLRLLV
jgi:lysozyme family protein